SACTPEGSIPALVSAWPSASELWSAMEDGSGWSPNPERARTSVSPSHCVERNMRRDQPAKPVQILLVEDSPGDIRLTREALKESKLFIYLNVVEDGVQAMAYLRREGEYARAVQPDLILLDLNLPKKDGREVLSDLKADPGLKHIPVVVLTSSRA